MQRYVGVVSGGLGSDHEGVPENVEENEKGVRERFTKKTASNTT